MITLLDISNLERDDIFQIWNGVSKAPFKEIKGNIAWSFEGNGIRTRTTFIQSFQELGLAYVELPNFLKTKESVQDLAGYMDSFYSMYVIRESNHQRMTDFANSTARPVINAMSSEAHPCEVLSDAYYLNSKYNSLQNLRLLLWGPVTNVFKSWHSLSKVLGLNLTHFCPKEYHESETGVIYSDNLTGQYDIVITDAWPTDFSDKKYSLSQSTLARIGSPELLPVPPVSLGKELLFPLSEYDGFSGYKQKNLLLEVQKSLIGYVLAN